MELLGNDRKPVELAIQRALRFNEPSRVSGANHQDPSRPQFSPADFPGVIELQQLRAELQSQRDDIGRIDSNGFRIVSVLDKRVCGIESEVAALRGTVCGLCHDFGALQKELKELKTDITERR